MEKILAIQNQKMQLLQQYEEVSTVMYQNEVYQLEELLQKRDDIKMAISDLDASLADCVSDQQEYQMLLSVLRNEKNHGDYSAKWQQVFEKAQSNLAIISRIKILDELVFNKVMLAQNELKNQIKAQQNVPKISKYLENSVSEKGSLLNHKSKKA